MNISVSGLSVTRQALTVLENINLDLPSGQIVGLLGPNGSGKSTLLRCLAGLFPHLGERVALNGTSLSVMPLKTRARHLAFVPQHADVEGELTVEDIVRLGRTPYRKAFQRSTRDDDAAVEEAISLMQLGGLRQRRWQHLSGGERQRSQIARALAQRPRVLLLDEPTNHLDIQHQLELMRLISRLPLTVVVALHDLNLAANYCQRLILLKAGRVSATGAPRRCSPRRTSRKPGASRRTSTGQTPGSRSATAWEGGRRTEAKNPAILLSQGFRIWRKRRDSNSRTLSGRRFSRPVPSTARPRFLSEANYKHLTARCKEHAHSFALKIAKLRLIG